MQRTVVTPVRPPSQRRAPWPIAFYRSSVGKKWAMAVSGVVLMGFVIAHLIGNLKLFLGRGEINLYGEALRDMPGHILPRTVLLWTIRLVLFGSFVVHISAAFSVWRASVKTKGAYQSKRDYLAADYASRTMRYSGVTVLAFLAFHLMDLTWGNANSKFLRGDPYNNLIFSLQRPAVAIAYMIGTLALGLHLIHGAWSMFQSLGINNPRINASRRRFAQLFAAVIVVGNLSFPIAVQLHIVEPTCSLDRTPSTLVKCDGTHGPPPGVGAATGKAGR
jgi:succinate dehydrogenase / fumarate reductase cytochrome b subunit